MRNLITALGAGFLFGAGLLISDMINPGRVLAFLDVAGRWDPTLALVMTGAFVPSFAAYLIRRRMNAPLLAADFQVPRNRAVDRRLAAGAALFGVGWGLAGFCPGPGIAALAFGKWQAWLFVAAMVSGMAIHRVATGSAVFARAPAAAADG